MVRRNKLMSLARIYKAEREELEGTLKWSPAPRFSFCGIIIK